MINYFSYLIPLIIELLEILILGILFANHKLLENKMPWRNLFLILTIGLLLFSSLISIYFTKGKTIQWLIIGILAFSRLIILPNKTNILRNLQSLKDISRIKICFILAFLILAYTFQFWQIYIPDANLFKPFYRDYMHYGEISKMMIRYGNENRYIFSDSFSGIEPYHYFELWITGFSAFIFHLNAPVSYLLITNFLLFFVLFVGLISIAESFNLKTNLIISLLGFLIIFTNGYNFELNSIFEIYKNHAEVILFPWPKILPIFIVFVLSFTFLRDKNYNLSFYTISLLAIISITAFPAYLVFISFVLFISFFKIEKKIYLLKYILFLLGLIFSYLIIYKLFGANVSLNKPAAITLKSQLVTIYNFIYYKIINIDSIKYFFFMFKGYLFSLIRYYIPFIILISFVLIHNRSVIKSNIIFILLFSLMIFSSIFASSLLFFQFGSGQFCEIIAPVAINLSTFLCMLFIWRQIQIRRKIFWICLFLYGLIIISSSFIRTLTYSLSHKEHYEYATFDFLKQINNITNHHLKGASLRSKNYYNQDPTSKFYFDYIASYLKLNNNFDNLICLNTYDIEVDKICPEFEQTWLNYSEMLHFLKQKKEKNQFTTYTQLQLDFINEKKIDFLVVSKDYILSDSIKRLVNHVYVNPVSKESLLFLK